MNLMDSYGTITMIQNDKIVTGTNTYYKDMISKVYEVAIDVFPLTKYVNKMFINNVNSVMDDNELLNVKYSILSYLQFGIGRSILATGLSDNVNYITALLKEYLDSKVDGLSITSIVSTDDSLEMLFEECVGEVANNTLLKIQNMVGDTIEVEDFFMLYDGVLSKGDVVAYKYMLNGTLIILEI